MPGTDRAGVSEGRPEPPAYRHGNWCVQTIEARVGYDDTLSTFLHNGQCRDLRERVGAPQEMPGLRERDIADLLDSEAVADFFGGGFESGEIRWLSAFLASGLAALSDSPQEAGHEWTPRKCGRCGVLGCSDECAVCGVVEERHEVGETPPGPLDALREALAEVESMSGINVSRTIIGVTPKSELEAYHGPRPTDHIELADDGAFIPRQDVLAILRAALTPASPSPEARAGKVAAETWKRAGEILGSPSEPPGLDATPPGEDR